MRHTVFHKVIISFICLSFIALGVVLGVLGIQPKASLNSISLNTDSISVNLSSNGDARIQEYMYFNNKTDDLKEMYVDVNYSKGLIKDSSPASFSNENVSFSVDDSFSSFSFNSTTNTHVTSGYTYGATYLDNNKNIKGETLIKESGHETFYLGRTSPFSTHFSISLNYTIKDFATIYNDMTYVEMNFKSVIYPAEKFSLTFTCPTVGEDEPLDIYSNFFSRGKEEKNTGSYRLEGEADNYYKGVKAAGVFSSSRMDSKQTMEENNRPYIDSPAPSFLSLKAHLYESNISLMVTTFLALIFSVISIVFLVINKKKDKKPLIKEKEAYSDLNPLLIHMLGRDYHGFEDSLIRYYVFRRNVLISVKDKKNSLYRLTDFKPCSEVDIVFNELFKHGDYPLKGLRSKIRNNRFKLIKACKADGLKEGLLINKFPYMKAYGLIPFSGIILGIVLICLCMLSSYNILVGLLVLVISLLYSDILFSSYRLTDKGQDAIYNKIEEVSSLEQLEEGSQKQKREKELCPYFPFMLK